MLHTVNKRDIAPNSRIKDSELKNQNTVFRLVSPKKKINSNLGKKNILCNTNSGRKDSKTFNSLLFAGTPKEKNQTSYDYFNLSNANPGANSAKNANKQIINYSSNPNIQKGQVKKITLFTIQEQMMKLSNGLTSKSNNYDTNPKKSSTTEITEPSLYSSNKLFQIKRKPLHCTENSKIRKINKTNNTPKSKPGYELTQWNTAMKNRNSLNSNRPNNNKARKRNERVTTLENTVQKRDLSLNKKSITTFKELRNNPNEPGHFKNHSISHTYKRVKQKKIDVCHSYVKKYNNKPNYQNKSNKNSYGNFKHCKSLKKEQSKTTNTNNTTALNNHDSTKDNLTHNSTQNSFVLSKKIIISLDNSIDNSYNKDKQQIKVNRKKQEFYSKYKPYKSSNLIKKYSVCLSQSEIVELKGFLHSIYYMRPFEVRLRNNIMLGNEINSTYSYKHFPGFIPSATGISKSKSYMSIFESFPDADNYNDEEGNYILVPGDHIYYRYEIIELLGKGSFGEAVKCFDHKTKELVCIKIIKSKQKLSIQAMTECLVFELLDINLYDHLKANNYVGFNINKIKSFATEVLFSLLFLKSHKILHCDLKPENILLCQGETDHVRVIDFGSSCFSHEKLYTYIQSRFYRAPEVILDQGYSFEIDIWSLGCILPELYTGVPIFPGNDERDQLFYIIEYLGYPSSEYINKSRKKYLLYDSKNQPLFTQKSTGNFKSTKTISSFLKGTDRLFQDFVKKCLRWNPKERITPEYGLMHEWIIKEMNTEELDLHKQKIKNIKKELLQINDINSVYRYVRPANKSAKRSNSKSNRSQPKTHNFKTIFFPKTPIKSIRKRTKSKENPRDPYTTKYSISKQIKYGIFTESQNETIKKS